MWHPSWHADSHAGTAEFENGNLSRPGAGRSASAAPGSRRQPHLHGSMQSGYFGQVGELWYTRPAASSPWRGPRGFHVSLCGRRSRCNRPDSLPRPRGVNGVQRSPERKHWSDISSGDRLRSTGLNSSSMPTHVTSPEPSSSTGSQLAARRSGCGAKARHRLHPPRITGARLPARPPPHHLSGHDHYAPASRLIPDGGESLHPCISTRFYLNRCETRQYHGPGANLRSGGTGPDSQTVGSAADRGRSHRD